MPNFLLPHKLLKPLAPYFLTLAVLLRACLSLSVCSAPPAAVAQSSSRFTRTTTSFEPHHFFPLPGSA